MKRKSTLFITAILMLVLIMGLLVACGEAGPQGPQGEPGKDGTTPVITIGSSGNWYINGVDTGVTAQGIQGPQGEPGVDGATPIITIGSNGNWTINGTDTGISATGLQGPQGEVGPQGPQGEPGDDGHTPVITIGKNGNWFVDGVDTGVKAQGADGQNGAQGADGTSLLTGNGVPADTLGKNGDSYIDLTNFDFYVKADSTWTKKGNIKGESGVNGATPDHDGTPGLEFYPINNTKCAVSAGTARLLEEIVIPSTWKGYSVTQILSNGFSSCPSLRHIIIPDSVTTIGEGAFYGCDSLMDVYYSGTKALWENNFDQEDIINNREVIVHCVDGDIEVVNYEIAVVTDVGQLMDGGYNQGTWEGAKAYADANNKTVKYYQPANGAYATDNDRIAAMELAISNGAKVIVAPGFLQATAMTTVALEHPEVKFVFIDGWTLTDYYGREIPNVTAVVYKEEESGFLAGYAAVMEGYRKLGFTGGGGGSNPAVNRYGYGFVQGAEAAAKALGLKAGAVEVKFSFEFGSSFSASPELQTQINGWYQSGTEVVFVCGGSMFDSVKAAAEANPGKKIIGVDVDQSALSDRVITSAVKGLKESVEIVLGQMYADKWDTELGGKCQNLGAADNVTGLPTATWSLKNFTVEQYNALFAQVKAGTLKIDANVPADANNAAWLCDAVVFVTIDMEGGSGCSHRYSNACDGECNVCGHNRTPASHIYDDASDEDCNECGEIRIILEHLQEVDYWYSNTDVGMTMVGYVVEIATEFSSSYQNVSLYIVDEDFCAGYYLYRVKCDDETAAQLVPGAPVIVTGTTNTNYNGLVETNADGTIQIDSDRTAINVRDHIYAIDNEIIGGLFSANYHQSSLVSLTNWTVKEVKAAPSAASSTETLFILTRGGVDVPVIVSKYHEGSYKRTAYDAVWEGLVNHGVKVGDVVSITGILGNYKGHNIALLSVSDIVKGGTADAEGIVYPGKTAKTAVDAIDALFEVSGLTAPIVAVEKAVELPEIAGTTIEATVLGGKSIKVENGILYVTPGKAENTCVRFDIKVGEFTTSIFRYIKSQFLGETNEDPELINGAWGNLTWALNKTTGELYISGTGEMDSFESSLTSAWREYKDLIKSVTIGDSVTTIGKYAFNNFESLTSVTIGNSVTIIDDHAVTYCENLTSIYIPDSVTFIGDRTFMWSWGLTSVTFGENSQLTFICEEAFYDCYRLTSIDIPASVTTISEKAFADCNRLTSVTFGENSQLTTIGNSAFHYCYNLTSVTIPDSVTTIGQYAFDDCYRLTSVTIGENSQLTTIGDMAFYGCYALAEVYNYSSLNVTKGSGNYGYVAYHALDVYTTNEPSKLTTDENGFVIHTNGDVKTLICYIGADTDITIPDGVTAIGDYAFNCCYSLTSVTIPDSVTTIGQYAFRQCNNLTSVTFEDPAGWYVSQTKTASSGTSVTLTNTSINESYLTSTYRDYYWYKN